MFGVRCLLRTCFALLRFLVILSRVFLVNTLTPLSLDEKEYSAYA